MHLRDTLTRPVYDINGLLDLVPVSRATIYAAIRSGQLRRSKSGRRTIFLADDIVYWLESLRSGTPGGR